jgi:TolA-binding protein
MKKIVVFFSLVLIVGTISFSQSRSGNAVLEEGIDYYRRGLYEQAIVNFRNIVLDPAQEAFHGDAFFWLSKSYVVLRQLDDAERSLESYLLNYKDHPSYSEGFYLKGRLLFMQDELESSIQVFQSFISQYPESSFLPNAYFWIGESLFLLGNFDSSIKIFQALLQDYPRSIKIEAAKYRISLIKLKKRENELLKLLKMSHEELLKTLEEFQKKERTYEQAIAAYQKRIAAMGKADRDAEIKSLREQLQDKEREIADLKSKVEEYEQRLQKETSLEDGTDHRSLQNVQDGLELIRIHHLLLQTRQEAVYLQTLLKSSTDITTN